MSLCQSMDERIEELRNIFKHTLKLTIMPIIMMPEDIFAQIDLVLGIDRRKIMVEVLREMALTLENSTMEKLNERLTDNDNPATDEGAGECSL